MRLVILHYHFFKNAGSTIENILDQCFGSQFGRLESGQDRGIVSNTEVIRYLDRHPEIRAISSHQIRYPLPSAPGYLFFDICFLRDPLDRLRSFYDYFRQRPNPADPMSDLANRSTLGEFAAAVLRNYSLFLRNNQVNLIACAGDSDEPAEDDLALALRTIRAASVAGIVDSFDRDFASGAKALSRAFPELRTAGRAARPAVNVSKGMRGTVESRVAELRAACGDQLFAELMNITELDRRLVEGARTRREAAPGASASPTPAAVAAPLGQAFPQLSVARRAINVARSWRELAGTPRKLLFDPVWYRDGLRHFLMEGVYAGRSPHPLFDPAFYLRKYPDVANAGLNPFAHYVKHGWKEMRQPHPLFDPVFYLERYPDVRNAGIHPLLHYLRHGAAEDRKPHRFFNPAYYRASRGSKLGDQTQNPLVHFALSGAGAASPHPLFDCEPYLEAHPEVAAAGVNPLVHYLDGSNSEASPQVNADPILLEIDDVKLRVFCLPYDPHWRGSLTGDTALAWYDEEQGTSWVAEPCKLRFLETVNLDQVLAQRA